MTNMQNYGGPAAATASHGAWTADGRRFPWLTMIILWILAVLLVIGLCKYGLDDTNPYIPSAAPVPTTMYQPPTPPPVYEPPLVRAG